MFYLILNFYLMFQNAPTIFINNKGSKLLAKEIMSAFLCTHYFGAMIWRNEYFLSYFLCSTL